MNRWWLILTSLFLFAGVSTRAAVKWADINRQSAEWYATPEAQAVAGSVVQFQKESGGWAKNTDMTQPPTAEYLASKKSEDIHPTIDNNGTTFQLGYLARVISANRDDALLVAFYRGFDYLLAAQYANGGWPQFFPLRPGYYTHITYNDNAMVNVLTLLRDARDGAVPYSFVDAGRRAKADEAVQRGIACILRTQIKQDEKLTVWCAQHDETTFQPVVARNFEPASLSGQESVGLLRFLMGIEQPPPEVVAAIEGGVSWLQSVPVQGLRMDNSAGADGAKDRRAVADASASPLWARFYELGSNKPIFLGRDKVVHYDFNEIERERRTGYTYLGEWPAKLIAQDYPRWRAKNNLP